MPIKLNKDGSLKLSENDVERQITDFLRYRGWWVLRLHVGTFHGISGGAPITMGEKGMADWLALPTNAVRSGFFTPAPMFFEVKAPGEKPRRDQKLWLANAYSEGFFSHWFDSLESFQRWYGERFGR